MTGRLTALLGLALLALAGCAVDGQAAADPLVVISGPKRFHSFELLDDRDQVIWRLVAAEPAPVDELYYGQVPAGFRQEEPADGSAPRALVEGEPLRLESVTPLRVFQHEGWVASGQRLTIEHWRMRLRNPPQGPRVDGTAAAPYE